MATAARHGTLTGSASGNSALLYANGSGQLDNSTAGYAVAVDGMASINATGHAGDTAQFFDSPGNDTFYAYADYNNSGQPLAGMYGQRLFQLGQRLRHQHRLFDQRRQRYGRLLRLAGQRHVLCLRGLQQQRQAPWRACTGSRAITNSASGFATNVGYSTNGGSDTAVFFDSPGNDTFYAYADYNNSGQPLAGMYGTRVFQSAIGFGSNVGYSTNGGSDTAVFFDSPGNDTFYAYADYNNSGQPLAGMAGHRVFQFGQRLRHQRRLFDQRRQRYGRILRLAGQQHVLCLRRLQQQRPALGGHVRHRRIPIWPAASAPTSDLRPMAATTRPICIGSSGNNTLYTNQSIALLYGSNFAEEASGFQVVNATGGSGLNTKDQGTVNYQLNYFGTWVGGG